MISISRQIITLTTLTLATATMTLMSQRTRQTEQEIQKNNSNQIYLNSADKRANENETPFLPTNALLASGLLCMPTGKNRDDINTTLLRLLADEKINEANRLVQNNIKNEDIEIESVIKDSQIKSEVKEEFLNLFLENLISTPDFDINKQSSSGDTIMHILARNGCFKQFNFMMEKYPDFNINMPGAGNASCYVLLAAAIESSDSKYVL